VGKSTAQHDGAMGLSTSTAAVVVPPNLLGLHCLLW